MKYMFLSPVLLILLSVFLIPITHEAAAQQNTLDKMGQKVMNFTQGAVQKLHTAGEKIEGYIHNATSDSNQTSKNMTPLELGSNLSSAGNSTTITNSTTATSP